MSRRRPGLHTVSRHGPSVFLRRVGWQRACTVVLAAQALACTSMPSRDPEPLVLEIPATWSTSAELGTGAAADSSAAIARPSATEPGALTAWWGRFDDPQLSQMLEAALRANTSIQAALAALYQAQALRDVAAAALMPALDVGASAQQGTAGGHSVGHSFRVAAEANWALDLFGAQRAALAAGAANAEASAASLGDVQVQISAELALNYILLRSLQSRHLIASANLANQEETLQITDWRQQAGLVTALETEQARAAVAQSRAQLPVLTVSIGQTQHALSVLSGRPPQASAAWLEPGESTFIEERDARTRPLARGAVPQASAALALSIPAQTLRQRADVRAAEYRVLAAASRLEQAQALRLPSFVIGGSLGLTALSLSGLGQGSAAFSSLLGSVSLPVFDGGALRAQQTVQQAALAQAQQAYRATVLAALQQVEDALLALHGDGQRLSSLRLAADSAWNAAELARQRYRSGLVDFQTVLETQRNQYATEDGVASAYAAVSSDQVRLFKALGGGWSAELEARN